MYSRNYFCYFDIICIIHTSSNGWMASILLRNVQAKPGQVRMSQNIHWRDIQWDHRLIVLIQGHFITGGNRWCPVPLCLQSTHTHSRTHTRTHARTHGRAFQITEQPAEREMLFVVCCLCVCVCVVCVTHLLLRTASPVLLSYDLIKDGYQWLFLYGLEGLTGTYEPPSSPPTPPPPGGQRHAGSLKNRAMTPSFWPRLAPHGPGVALQGRGELTGEPYRDRQRGWWWWGWWGWWWGWWGWWGWWWW